MMGGGELTDGWPRVQIGGAGAVLALERSQPCAAGGGPAAPARRGDRAVSRRLCGAACTEILLCHACSCQQTLRVERLHQARRQRAGGSDSGSDGLGSVGSDFFDGLESGDSDDPEGGAELRRVDSDFLQGSDGSASDDDDDAEEWSGVMAATALAPPDPSSAPSAPRLGSGGEMHSAMARDIGWVRRIFGADAARTREASMEDKIVVRAQCCWP
eukprot:COSAG01_NODE_3110_length_6571_cov_218.696539_12_plen_215_part_00